MCFSASASFGAGAVLSVVGAAAIKKVNTPSQMLFASIPLFFSMQQIAEGFLWLSLTHHSLSSIQSITTNIFIFFAQVVWPTLVPYSIYKFREEDNYKNMQKLLIGAGLSVSICLGYCLLASGVEAQIIGHHISYKQDYPIALKWTGAFLYVIATIVPLFISSVKKMRLLGTTILLSYILSTILYSHFVISVWCFFSAVISILIFYIVREESSSRKMEKQSSSSDNSY